MKNRFGKWSLEHPGNPAQTKPQLVYFYESQGSCELHMRRDANLEPYRRLIASAPDLRELLIAALPALQEMQERTPEHLENLAGVAIVDRVKVALAFIDGVEPENNL